MVDKVSLLKFKNKNKSKALLEKAKRELPQYLENIEYIAKMRKGSYEAHLKEGFTPEQALFLCKEF